jgi:hypothetical protein
MNFPLALREKVKQRHANYHIPISNTAAGLMVLEPQGRDRAHLRGLEGPASSWYG